MAGAIDGAEMGLGDCVGLEIRMIRNALGQGLLPAIGSAGLAALESRPDLGKLAHFLMRAPVIYSGCASVGASTNAFGLSDFDLRPAPPTLTREPALALS